MKHKPKPKHPAPRRPPPWQRNASGDDELDVPEQLIMPAPVDMSMGPYNPAFAAAQMQRRPQPRASLTRRAAAKVREKAAVLVPVPVKNPLNKDHLLRVAAGAGGGVAASVIARELGDNLGEKNTALGLAALGAIGSLFLDDNWQRVASGVLSGGINQWTGAYLTERAEGKAAKERKLRETAERAALAALAAVPPAAKPAPAAPPRNAHYAANDNDVYGAVNRAHQAVNDMLAEDGRNAAYAYPSPYADGVIDVDPIAGYPA